MAEETRFNPETYTHVLPEGQEDFEDFTEADLQQNPELGYTDEQVEAEVGKDDGRRKEFVLPDQGLHGHFLSAAWVHHTPG